MLCSARFSVAEAQNRTNGNTLFSHSMFSIRWCSTSSSPGIGSPSSPSSQNMFLKASSTVASLGLPTT